MSLKNTSPLRPKKASQIIIGPKFINHQQRISINSGNLSSFSPSHLDSLQSVDQGIAKKSPRQEKDDQPIDHEKDIEPIKIHDRDTCSICKKSQYCLESEEQESYMNISYINQERQKFREELQILKQRFKDLQMSQKEAGYPSARNILTSVKKVRR